jgi:hypothetical protein
VRDGNSSDKKANGEMIEALCQWFSPAELRRSVYVALSRHRDYADQACRRR